MKRDRSPRNRARGRLLVVLGLPLLLAAGCRQGMYDQPKVEPYEASATFLDGAGNRPLPADTIARGWLREDAVTYTGMDAAGAFTTTLPVELDRPLLERGRQRFGIFCAPCHGATGSGNGMIVQRGFPTAASFHEDRLRTMPVGYFFNVMTQGFGRMPSYASQISVEDRWAIAAYVRVLQLSQGVPVAELSAADRQRVAAGENELPAAPEQDDGHGGDHGDDGGEEMR